MVRALVLHGCSAELGALGAKHPTKIGIRPHSWHSIFREVKSVHLGIG
jgi:hypothetical protein